MDVSVIIVNYNTLRMVEDCIRSIKEHTVGCTYEIILVDNASSDGSVEYFSKVDDILFLSLSENIGFGKANNVGVQKARGKYLFFLNSDTYLCNNAIKLFFDYLENVNDSVGAVGSLLLNPDREPAHSFGSFPTIGKSLSIYFISPIYKIMGKRYSTMDDLTLVRKDPFNVDYVTGADLFVSKELLTEYGSFDPDFFMYFEETELQYRLSRNGYPSRILTGPEIVHMEGASLKKKAGKRNLNKMFMNQHSQFVYFKKTRSVFAYYSFRALLFIVRIPFLLFAGLTSNQRKKYFYLLISKI